MISIAHGKPALVLAPMDGLTDAPMRAVQGGIGAFDYAVSEFIRVAQEIPPAKTFRRDVPELLTACRTPTGLPVQVQILGGDPDRMAIAATTAVDAGATAIDINFGCPAPTVNRHDGGATLLKYPDRIYTVVKAVRDALPVTIPVSAKMRLGWDSIEPIFENAQMAEDAGASWITIHGRTKMQRYAPPAHWEPIGLVRERLSIPVVANGDIWNIDEFRRCRDVTGCAHFMLGRCAIANPNLANEIAQELGIGGEIRADAPAWIELMHQLHHYSNYYEFGDSYVLCRLKQWLAMASRFGSYRHFDSLKRANTLQEFMSVARLCEELSEGVVSVSSRCELAEV